jgi:magnesium chelatase family protein
MPYDENLPILEFSDLKIIFMSSLKQVIDHLSGRGRGAPFTFPVNKVNQYEMKSLVNFEQVIGHKDSKRALEVAAAGGHHVLMTGPPGCGKSMLAESFPSILPALTKQAQLEVISLYQLSGSTCPDPRIPPFRNPHHSASAISIIGGGTYPKPGEISLAHQGVLFLDEIAEFPKKLLDMLRQPFENGKIKISRTHATISYPAEFTLIAAMNPCPCGYAGSNTHYCTCTKKQVISYKNRISGPLQDRFDIHLSLRPVIFSEDFTREEPSEIVRDRVEEARKRQYNRYEKEICNSRVTYDVLLQTSPLTVVQQRELQHLSARKNWSSRTQIKIIRLARTISDLNGSPAITDQSIEEAIKLNGVKYR